MMRKALHVGFLSFVFLALATSVTHAGVAFSVAEGSNSPSSLFLIAPEKEITLNVYIEFQNVDPPLDGLFGAGARVTFVSGADPAKLIGVAAPAFATPESVVTTDPASPTYPALDMGLMGAVRLEEAALPLDSNGRFLIGVFTFKAGSQPNQATAYQVTRYDPSADTTAILGSNFFVYDADVVATEFVIQTTGQGTAIPLPAAAWGGVALLGGLAVMRRRQA